RPEVNLIYSEASNLTVGTMAGLSQIGRGKFEDGKPLTEIVASVDFDSVEFDQVYDPNSSLKVSMGLPPIETAQGRIDLIMDVVDGKVAASSDPAEEHFYKAYTVSYWSMPKEEAEAWLAAQFGEYRPPVSLGGRRLVDETIEPGRQASVPDFIEASLTALPIPFADTGRPRRRCETT
ncbi:MAG: hypothetical protein RLO48_08500, partial [Bauldia litoralis]